MLAEQIALGQALARAMHASIEDTAPWLEDVKITGAGILPRDAELELMKASKHDDPRTRVRAIDRAYDSTTARYPNLFKN